jgi:hypothetical protein
MTTLIFVGCVLSLTVASDWFGFVILYIPEGYEDEFGFHFGAAPKPEIE